MTLDARVLRSQLRPTRAAGLQESRAFAVNDSAAALRRIERDLHDGAQAQLVTLAMKLGLAKDELTAGDTAPPSPWSTPRMSAPSRPSSSLPRLK